MGNMTYKTAKIIMDLRQTLESSVCERIQDIRKQYWNGKGFSFGNEIPVFIETIWETERGYAGAYRLYVFSGDKGEIAQLSCHSVMEMLDRYSAEDATRITIQSNWSQTCVKRIKSTLEDLGLKIDMIKAAWNQESGKKWLEIWEKSIAQKEAERLEAIRKEREARIQAKLLQRKNAKFLAKFPINVPGTYAKFDFVPNYVTL